VIRLWSIIITWTGVASKAHRRRTTPSPKRLPEVEETKTQESSNQSQPQLHSRGREAKGEGYVRPVTSRHALPASSNKITNSRDRAAVGKASARRRPEDVRPVISCPASLPYSREVRMTLGCAPQSVRHRAEGCSGQRLYASVRRRELTSPGESLLSNQG